MKMNEEELNKILELHLKWLKGEKDGVRANLFRANLSGANLSRANLSGANLSRANLSRANLSGANLDFSVLPLWCGSFNMKVDDNILEQILTHIKMFNVSKCSKENQLLVRGIPDRVKDKLRSRHGLDI